KTGLRLTDATDGTSQTAMMSESLLGEGPENFAGPMPGSPQRVYAYVWGQPLSDSNCATAGLWNVEQHRGFLWATGEIRCASYNHYYTPNAGLPDCITNDFTPGEGIYTALGFRAARSHHTGGVNLLLCDGSVHFVTNAVSLQTWRALGTRSGSEVLDNSF